MKNKKIFIFIFIIILICIVISYYKKDKPIEDDDMYIENVNLSSDEYTILNALDGESMFFNYKVNKSINKMKISFYKYQDENWILFQEHTHNLDLPTRRENTIGLELDEKDIYIIQEIRKNQVTQSKYEHNINFNNLEYITKSNLTKETIELNKEIVLFRQYAYKEEKDKGQESQDFRKDKCDEGLVVTICFTE